MLACIQRRQNLSSQHLACTPKSLNVPPPPLQLSVPPLQPCKHKGEFLSRIPETHQTLHFELKTVVMFQSPLWWNDTEWDAVAHKCITHVFKSVHWDSSWLRIMGLLMMMMMPVNWAPDQTARTLPMCAGQSGFTELINSLVQDY